MQSEPRNPAGAPQGMSLFDLADLQDHLLSATNDLARLEGLLADACRALLTRFQRATEQVRELATPDSAAREQAVAEIAGAVTALQFEDMASQLIAHTCQRLHHCADRLAQQAFSEDSDGETLVLAAPLRPNPVTQSEVDAGSIELF
jgi:hypothetical protein